jgi:hypothetical protein
MSDVYDDEESEDENEHGQSDPSRRPRIIAMQEATRAVEDAMRAALKTSRYLPWLVAIAAACAVIVAATIAFSVAANLIHAPQSVP